jgi:hypothetical protein
MGIGHEIDRVRVGVGTWSRQTNAVCLEEGSHADFLREHAVGSASRLARMSPEVPDGRFIGGYVLWR